MPDVVVLNDEVKVRRYEEEIRRLQNKLRIANVELEICNRHLVKAEEEISLWKEASGIKPSDGDDTGIHPFMLQNRLNVISILVDKLGDVLKVDLEKEI